MATEIGTRIKRARERKRWSQQQLADALKVDRKTVDNWENGRTRPRSSIGALEEVLGTPLAGEAEQVPAIPQSLYREIMDNDDLTPEEREAVIAAITDTLKGRGKEASSPFPGEAPGRPRRAS